MTVGTLKTAAYPDNFFPASVELARTSDANLCSRFTALSLLISFLLSSLSEFWFAATSLVRPCDTSDALNRPNTKHFLFQRRGQRRACLLSILQGLVTD